MLSTRAYRAMPLCLSILSALTSSAAFADTSLFTAMDDPSTAKKSFDGNVQAGYNSQSGNSESSNLLANTTMTWFNPETAYSLWGTANNTKSGDTRSSEKYQAGARSRYNLSPDNYMFGQGSWLNDRYAGYDSRSTGTLGYGRQMLATPSQNLRVEFGPGVRHDEYHGGGHETQALAYAAGNYAYQLTKNTQFTQGVSVMANDDTTVNSETALNVGINDDFSLRLSYNMVYNTEPPASAPKKTDTSTAITLQYNL